MMYYTGVGARVAPQHILDIMFRVGAKMATLGYCLRSGGADGPDLFFEYGCDSVRGPQEIYLEEHATQESMALAARFHPAWHRVGEKGRRLHGRNPFQVLGEDLRTPSVAVLCWTIDGAITHAERSYKTGGTGTAISIASFYNVPVYNLWREDHLDRVLDWLDR